MKYKRINYIQMNHGYLDKPLAYSSDCRLLIDNKPRGQSTDFTGILDIRPMLSCAVYFR